jgi:hypothetical protein
MATMGLRWVGAVGRETRQPQPSQIVPQLLWRLFFYTVYVITTDPLKSGAGWGGWPEADMTVRRTRA